MTSTATAPIGSEPVLTRDPVVFTDVVSSAFVPLRLERPAHGSFFGRLATTEGAGVSATEIEASAHRVTREPLPTEAPRAASYKLSLMVSGRCMLAQDGREAVLGPGDLVLYETTRPYVLEMDREFRKIVVMLPHGAVGLPSSRVDRLTAVRMTSRDGVGQVVASFLATFTAQSGALDRAARDRLGRCAADLITALLAQQLTPADPRPHQRELVERCKAYIDERLGEPELSPGEIAAAQFISPRYLHALFHAEGITVSSWIRRRRLERCHRDLTDPLLAGAPVATIAARWGFLDPAHFSRAFRSAYGVAPSALRG